MDLGYKAAAREDIVIGRNPVIELLKSGNPVDSILLQHGDARSGSIVRIAAMAREMDIPVKDVPKEKLDSMCGGASHQGVIAVTAGYSYSQISDIFKKAGEEPVFIVIADEIEDPHNLGAIIRSAEAAGAHGVILPKRRGAGLTTAAFKSSAGAAAHIPVVRVTNIAQTIEELKKQGIWFYAADMDGQSWCSVSYSGPVALVIGSEGHGVSRLVKERCDHVVSLPLYGNVASLNASVAAGVLIYEIIRQRRGLKTI